MDGDLTASSAHGGRGRGSEASRSQLAGGAVGLASLIEDAKAAASHRVQTLARGTKKLTLGPGEVGAAEASSASTCGLGDAAPRLTSRGALGRRGSGALWYVRRG